jgi:hypothetical protein
VSNLFTSGPNCSLSARPQAGTLRTKYIVHKFLNISPIWTYLLHCCLCNKVRKQCLTPSFMRWELQEVYPVITLTPNMDIRLSFFCQTLHFTHSTCFCQYTTLYILYVGFNYYKCLNVEADGLEYSKAASGPRAFHCVLITMTNLCMPQSIRSICL